LIIFLERAFDDDDLLPDICDFPPLVDYLLLIDEFFYGEVMLAFVRCNENTPPTLDGLLYRQLFSLNSSGKVLRLIIF